MSFYAFSIMAVTVGCLEGGIWAPLSPRAHLFEVIWRCCELGLEPFSIQLQQRCCMVGLGSVPGAGTGSGLFLVFSPAHPYPIRGSGELWILSQFQLVLGLLDKNKRYPVKFRFQINSEIV